MKYFSLVALLCSSLLSAQNTVGLLTTEETTLGGYNLIYPEQQSTVFLINECGEIVHTWEDHPDNRPGKTAYLTENGNLIRSKVDVGKITESTIGAGGSGGVVELLSWDNETLWCYVLADSFNRQHHDIHPMPNGNVLLIAWEYIGLEEMIENGFDTASFTQTEYWPDYIRELDPMTGDTVWEWHAWDHLIQDYDSTKAHFGVIHEHPELIDLNYNEYSGGRPDWMHSNALDYDPIKDQVLLSVRNFNEIWIIDHSTTIEEAAGHTGGNSGRGGDLLYRWGNPQAYKSGEQEDRQLFLQHDAQWIDDFVNSDYEHVGKIILFNNFINSAFSRGQILEPVWDETTSSYLMNDSLFLPTEFTEEFSHPDPTKNEPTIASSIQAIGNGHILMMVTNQGFGYELDLNGNVVWEYKVPLRNGFPVEQGTELTVSENSTFQMERYPENYSAFIGKDLSSKGFIELEPNTSFCLFTEVEEIAGEKDLIIYPNPVSDYLFVENKNNYVDGFLIYNNFGQVVFEVEKNIEKINVRNWPEGIYFIKEMNKGVVQKFIVTN